MLTKIKNIAKDAAKGVKKIMNKTVDTINDLLSFDANKKITTGIFVVCAGVGIGLGLGGGLIMSGYVEKTL